MNNGPCRFLTPDTKGCTWTDNGEEKVRLSRTATVPSSQPCNIAVVRKDSVNELVVWYARLIHDDKSVCTHTDRRHFAARNLDREPHS